MPNDTNGAYDVFVRDAQAANPERISVDSSEAQANNSSVRGGLSADGRYVAFSSAATNLIVGDANGRSDIFLRDRQAGTTEIVSLASDETPWPSWIHFSCWRF
ncbi:MAG: hypothetical protein HY319_18720, partial [Armatimonadetes bacterium]|nr:hypothetical protein [Armatimonadota bacterium]